LEEDLEGRAFKHHIYEIYARVANAFEEEINEFSQQLELVREQF